MSTRQLINLYSLVERSEVSSDVKELIKAVLTLSELNRLADVRIEELERHSRVKGAPAVIDGRDISVLIEGKQGEST